MNILHGRGRDAALTGKDAMLGLGWHEQVQNYVEDAITVHTYAETRGDRGRGGKMD